MQHAIETVKGRNGSKPEVKQNYSVRYNFPRSVSVSENWDKLSLSTLEGRVKLDFDVPKCYQQYLDYDVRESTLIEKNGELYFCFVFVKEVNVDVRRDSRILGVDLGVNKVAVTSDGDFYGTEVKQKRIERDQFVATLQAKGTHEVHNRAKKYGSRWKGFMSWKNHNISRQIVEKLEPGDVVVMEDLAYIRDNNSNVWVHKWSFRQLQNYIEYKAPLKGIRVVDVNPRTTSKRCNRCHSLHTERNGGFFECKRCGHTLDADLNGARNIAQRYMRITGPAGSRKPAYESGNYEPDSPSTLRARGREHLKAPS